ncbi:MAG TPA: LD-carboxypeptidase [Firmicutes bacterium]|nr:LD-carboxypeptidase [Bacillota bacterium]
MNFLKKPLKLHKGDTIATISPCNGWAGDLEIKWKYELGVKRLQEIGLNVIAAPNSLKGTDYLSKNPQARAEDFMWAFTNKNVNAVIANMGGNDSIQIIPYIDPKCIQENPKIFVGYSDVMNLHLLCYKYGLSTFYGDNLLYPIAEAQGWHDYSKKWFMDIFFTNNVIGTVPPAKEWTYEPTDYTNPHYIRRFYKNDPYELLQGKGIVQGKLFGGHTGLMELNATTIELSQTDFKDKILFLEDIPECYTKDNLVKFFDWLGQINALEKLHGVVLGKTNQKGQFQEEKNEIVKIISDKYGLYDLPVLYGLNFGHSSPICILPYGAMAEINCDSTTFSILESGTI